MEQGYRQAEKYRIFYELTYEWAYGAMAGKNIAGWIAKNGYRTVAIYGLGALGQMAYSDLCRCKDIRIKYGLDRRDNIGIRELKTYRIENCPEPVELIIVTAITSYEEIKAEIKEKLDFPCKLISLMQLVEEMYI